MSVACTRGSPAQIPGRRAKYVCQMRTTYLFGLAIIVGGWLGFEVAARRGDSQPAVRRSEAEQSANAGREAVDSANFRIHAGWQPLFNGRNLDGWYTFLQQHGR